MIFYYYSTRLVERYGYPAEEHKVWTIDGYKLRIHRIPGSSIWPQASGKPVVFIQHGILASSDMFVLAGPDKDLGNIIYTILADAGYDVWLGNSRGNTYSKSHVRLSPSHSDFWQFSFHEIALYDLSSMIDYVLHETNQPSLVYVAHSMGTTEGLILLSSKPEYNKKIHLVINLATISNWKKPRNFMKFLKEYGEYIKAALIAGGFTEVLPQTLVNYGISHGICRDGNIFQQICIGVVQFISGYNSELLDNELLANGLAYFPAGTSRQTLFHFHQNMIAGKLQMYDHGFIQNFALYKQFTPPAYNLENIVTRVIMFYGNGDAVATPEEKYSVYAAECETRMTIIQPERDIAEDNNQYLMINIPGFVQNATAIECLPNQSCAKGSCQQDYKLHQFLSLPTGKQQFELSDLQFRFFKIPHGCKCSA